MFSFHPPLSHFQLKLVKPTPSRFEHLVTQMKWRIREGKGEAIYEIGVEDNGMLVGLADEDLAESLNTLERMAKRLEIFVSHIFDTDIYFFLVIIVPFCLYSPILCLQVVMCMYVYK